MTKTPRRSLKYRAFAIMYKRFQLPLMKFLVSKTGGNIYMAEEVFSRTVEAGLRGWERFEHKSSFFTWICKISLNKLADYYRDQFHRNSLLITPILGDLGKIKDNRLTPEEKLLLEDLKDKVHECIQLLPEETRKLVFLRFWDRLTLKKIAVLLGISERSVEGKLYRAKLVLKDQIIKKYPHLS